MQKDVKVCTRKWSSNGGSHLPLFCYCRDFCDGPRLPRGSPIVYRLIACALINNFTAFVENNAYFYA